MRIVRVRIRNFRCIKSIEFFPRSQNVFLGPNNTGKTAILEALNLLLNPRMSRIVGAIDENDFYERKYLPQSDPTTEEVTIPSIYIEAILNELTDEDIDAFGDHLVPWDNNNRTVTESSEEGADAFNNMDRAIRVCFEGKYDSNADDFECKTFFLSREGMPSSECEVFHRQHKRRIGFLIYRDFRALTNPITLKESPLFGELVKSQEAEPHHFEECLDNLRSTLDPIMQTSEFTAVLNLYKSELERYLSLSPIGKSQLSFQLTDRTRRLIKENAQLHIYDNLLLPLQSMGAGTRSLAILAILTLIMRQRGRGILALEEPETFLFPHAQRRVLDECIGLATQIFVTTHSPYVLERIPIEGVGRVSREIDGKLEWKPLPRDSVKKINHYSKTLRQTQCEALVGTGVIVTEGESDRCWLLGISRILNKKLVFEHKVESFELIGVCINSSEGSGGIIKYGGFFQETGLKVLGLFDKISDHALLAQASSAQFPCIFLRYAGLEKLLSEELSVDILTKMLCEAPISVVPLKSREEIAGHPEASIRDDSFQFLRNNKGTISLHEWLISQLDEHTLPITLVRLAAIAHKYFAEGANLGVSSAI